MSSTTAPELNTPASLPAKPLSQPTPAEHSVYVGDLPANITEEELVKVFSQASPVLSIQIKFPSRSVKGPRAYAYIAYSSADKVDEAIREYNHTKFAGKPCRVMKPKGGIVKGPPEANVFVQDLPLTLSALAFHDTFAEFGEILSSRLSVDRANVSKGYGFIQYATVEQARAAIAETNGSLLDVAGGEKPIRTSIFVKKDAPSSPTSRAAAREFKNLFFKNLPADITLEAFKATWSKYGVITSAVLTLDKDGKPTGTAFASFQNHSDAVRVIKATQRKGPDEVYAVRALSKAERTRYKSRKDAKATEASTSA
ncbi:hypothetical protein PGTUg99_007627 [Puccinia graminis f. sp. tritici]|uniref:RRM domain-containing protein n=1 Tax=Puccinia graminis f. sp. tritici TaxID=56615 RepID=A0A5B0M5B1_PUCGR|nr:hypothetical protein PGTUg99_007627 [Puccinia graminis f. sp. tritici]